MTPLPQVPLDELADRLSATRPLALQALRRLGVTALMVDHVSLTPSPRLRLRPLHPVRGQPLTWTDLANANTSEFDRLRDSVGVGLVLDWCWPVP